MRSARASTGRLSAVLLVMCSSSIKQSFHVVITRTSLLCAFDTMILLFCARAIPLLRLAVLQYLNYEQQPCTWQHRRPVTLPTVGYIQPTGLRLGCLGLSCTCGFARQQSLPLHGRSADGLARLLLYKPCNLVCLRFCCLYPGLTDNQDHNSSNVFRQSSPW